MGVGENIIKILFTAAILSLWQLFGQNIVQTILGRQPQFYEVFIIYTLLLLIAWGMAKAVIRTVKDEEP